MARKKKMRQTADDSRRRTDDDRTSQTRSRNRDQEASSAWWSLVLIRRRGMWKATMTKPRLRLSLATSAATTAQGGGQAAASAAAVAVPSDPPTSPSKDENAATATVGVAEQRSTSYFEQEGQKASHLFGVLPGSGEPSADAPIDGSSSLSRCIGLAKPACLVIDCPAPSTTTRDENEDNENEKDDASCDTSSSNDNSCQLPFRYGGLELRANSRNVEVYLTEESTGKEKYVVTSRGVKDGESIIESEDGATTKKKVEWHKFVIVNRGGPATVTSVRLKMLSVKPADCNMVYVHLCRVKAKLLDVEEATKATTVMAGGGGGGGQHLQQQRAAPQAALPQSPAMAAGLQGQPPSMTDFMAAMMGGGGSGGEAAQSHPVASASATPATPFAAPQSATSMHRSHSESSSLPTHADMGAAISALRMMVSSTEESISRRIIDSTNRLDAASAARISILEKKIDNMNQVTGEQTEIILKQRCLIVEQSEMMSKMAEKQDRLMVELVQGQKKIMEMMEKAAEAETVPVATSIPEQSTKEVGNTSEPEAAVSVAPSPKQSTEDVDNPSTPEAAKPEPSSPQSSKEGWIEVQDEANSEGASEDQSKQDEISAASAPAADIVQPDTDKPLAADHATPDMDDAVSKGEDADAAQPIPDETPKKQPVMTYRGAEDLLSFEDFGSVGDALSSVQDGGVESEAIADLLMSTVDTCNGDGVEDETNET